MEKRCISQECLNDTGFSYTLSLINGKYKMTILYTLMEFKIVRFNEIAPNILEADAVVFTMPVYWYSIPAQVKGVIDRLFSFCVAGKDLAGKECALITCCEEDDMSVMDGVRIPVERSAALLKWKMVGEVLVPGVLNVGDIEKTDGCNQAAALADKF